VRARPKPVRGEAQERGEVGAFEDAGASAAGGEGTDLEAVQAQPLPQASGSDSISQNPAGRSPADQFSAEHSLSVKSPAARSSPAVSPAGQSKGFAAIFTDPHFRRLALTIFALSGVMFAYQGLWGGPLLVQGLGRDVGQAGRALLLLAVANSLGFFASGLLARRFGMPRIIITGALLAASVLVVLLTAQPGWPTWLLYLLYALLGAGTSAGVLGYAQAREFFPHMAGRAVTAINFFGLGGGAVMQLTLGAVVALAVSALGAEAGATPLAAHRWALAVSLALVVVGIIAYRPLLGTRTRPSAPASPSP